MTTAPDDGMPVVPSEPEQPVFDPETGRYCCDEHAVEHIWKPGEVAECRHCGRSVSHVADRWIDPAADGDDIIWRETCDANDTERAAPHEPKIDD